MSTMYNDTPAGQCGNVDCGQMAAWYIFSALGFYPVNPDSGVYAIGSPVVSKAVVHLDRDKYHGRTFTVIAKNNSAENIYIQSAELNGKPLTKPWLTYGANHLRRHLAVGDGAETQSGMGQRLGRTARRPRCPPISIIPLCQLRLRTSWFNCPSRSGWFAAATNRSDGFVPDPNTVAGGMNHADVAVDTDVPHAAPAAVYQNECYGKRFRLHLSRARR